MGAEAKRAAEGKGWGCSVLLTSDGAEAKIAAGITARTEALIRSHPCGTRVGWPT